MSTWCWKYIVLLACAALVLVSAVPASAQSGNGAVVYTYDALGRVTSASYDNNTTINYTYDAAGNRIQQAVVIGAPPGAPPSPPPAPGLLPSGPAGPAGPPGPAGPTGPAGPSQWTVSGSTIFYNGGNVGIGMSNPGFPLEVSSTSTAPIVGVTSATGSYGVMGQTATSNGWGVFGYSPSTSCYGGLGIGSSSAAGNCGSSFASDIRLKTDVKPVAGGLETIMALKPVTFLWKTKAKNHRLATDETRAARSYGFIAQDVEAVLPELVTPIHGVGALEHQPEPKSGYLFLDYNGIIAPLVKAVQELKAANDRQAAEIKALQEENRKSKEQISRVQ